MREILVALGTRPEAIKLAPVVRELRRQGVPFRVCVTAQHRELLDPLLELFGIPVHYDLNVMRPDQDPFHVTTAVLRGLKPLLRAAKPALVLVQGDTTSALAAALAASYERIPVAHVEAGLRTGLKHSPFPEELNRRLIDHLSDWLFAPTERAARNLRAEGIERGRVWVTGNTGVDALHMAVRDERFGRTPLPWPPDLARRLGRRLVLVTAHRREHLGEPLRRVCRAIRAIAERRPDVDVVYPVHKNPKVRAIVQEELKGAERVWLLEPLPYLAFLKLLARAEVALTDSGGVQEEAPSFGVPVLVLRDATERPEGVERGLARLVGTDPERIVRETLALLEGSRPARARACTRARAAARPAKRPRLLAANPYGDGRAAERIVRVLKRAL